MAAVDSFSLLYREIARSWHDSCNAGVETLALVGAIYTVSKAVTLARDCCTLVRIHFLPRVVPCNKRLTHRFGQWAVISGVSESIAKAYAEELARQGVNIILVSHDSASLSDTVFSISQTHGVEALLVVADFSKGPEASKLVREALKGKDIGFLVNCVVELQGLPRSLMELSEERLWDSINRNIAATTLMTRLVLPGMVERKRGAVVNIASGACWRPSAGRVALIAATAYQDSFSRALHHEYRFQGIFVQSLMPYRVAPSGPGSTAGSWLVPRPEVYARHAISTLGISHRTTGYWPHTLQYGLVQCIPEWIWVLGSRMIISSS
ncbi:inactive hydroxysteroid dehydrogenase-like protein 1 [Osmerus eperlanus]|uniref:inactive hydroxysteroid dehydrogenase-like protein 1 n=1 Tax=Osmerus eperlanus TaxID=29151 RepID=UPI002E136DCB